MRKASLVAHLFLASSVARANDLSDSPLSLELPTEHQFHGLPLRLYSQLDSNKEIVNPQVNNFPLKSGNAESNGDSSKRIWYLVLLGLLVAGLVVTASATGASSNDSVSGAAEGLGGATDAGAGATDAGGVATGGDGGIAGGGTADDTRPAQQINDRNEDFPLRGAFLSAGVIEIEKDATAQITH